MTRLLSFIWLLFLTLAAVILVYPVRLSLTYSPIESIAAIENIPVFAVLFCLWVFSLIILLRFANPWQGAILCGTFSFVLLGFFVLASPQSNTETWAWAFPQLRHLHEVGKIDPMMGYSDFPGIFLLGSFTSQITGLDIVTTTTVVLLSWAFFLGIVCYLLMTRIMPNSELAATAAVLSIMGNMWITRWMFFPALFGLLLLLIAVLVVLLKPKALMDSGTTKLLFIIVSAALVVTHLVSTVFLIFILIGLYATDRIIVKRANLSTSILLVLVMFLSWEVFATATTMDSLVSTIPKLIADFREGDSLGALLNIGGANVGSSTPLWASLTKLFWLVGLYGLGIAMGLGQMFRLRRMTDEERHNTGSLLGILVAAGTATLTSIGGFQVTRFVQYGSFFTTPQVIRLFDRLRSPLSFCLIAVVLAGISLPTFLAHNNAVGLLSVQTQEIVASEFLAKSFPQGKGLILNSPRATVDVARPYWLPQADVITEDEIIYIYDQDELISQSMLTLESFAKTSKGKTAVYISSLRNLSVYQRYFNLSPQDPRLAGFQAVLSGFPLVYENSVLQIHVSSGDGSYY